MCPLIQYRFTGYQLDATLRAFVIIAEAGIRMTPFESHLGICRVRSEEQPSSNPGTQNLCWVNWKFATSRMAMKLLIWPDEEMILCNSVPRV
jgi:hypothetical protein